MKTHLIPIKFLILIFFIIFPSTFLFAKGKHYNSPFIEQNDLFIIEAEIEARWEKLQSYKKKFIPYSQKSKHKISSEFHKIKKIRRKLWYHDPDKPHPTMNKDYLVAETLIKKGDYSGSSPHLAFAYNCVDPIYNASHILINEHHFIAMQGPSDDTIDRFFRLLLSQDVDILLRLKPEKEYLEQKKELYWKDYIIEGFDYFFIQPQFHYQHTRLKGFPIPYFFTDSWADNEAIDVSQLYNLVETVRKTYKRINKNGPIACHCSVGVGRTGTFIAAYALAHMLDHLKPHEISIEELVLKLSIQRPLMVSVSQQYLLLYEFVDYYLQQKKSCFHNHRPESSEDSGR